MSPGGAHRLRHVSHRHARQRGDCPGVGAIPPRPAVDGRRLDAAGMGRQHSGISRGPCRGTKSQAVFGSPAAVANNWRRYSSRAIQRISSHRANGDRSRLTVSTTKPMADAISLREIQAWMQCVLMHPGGAVDGIASSAAKGHLEITSAELNTLIAPSQELSSLERLEIYARAYYARLLECLRTEFPVLAKAMGQDLFDQFAVQYLQRYPPSSYTLAELGSRFTSFLAETKPPAPGGNRPEWSDLFVDLARLESIFNEIFDGPGSENWPPLDPLELQVIPPDRWADIRLIPASCLRLAEFHFPIGQYYRALRDDDGATSPPASATYLAITRRDYICRHHELSYDEFVLLSAVAGGQTLGHAVAALV